MRDEDRDDWEPDPPEDTTPMPFTVVNGALNNGARQPMQGTVWVFVGWGIIALSAAIVIGGFALLWWWLQ